MRCDVSETPGVQIVHAECRDARFQVALHDEESSAIPAYGHSPLNSVSARSDLLAFPALELPKSHAGGTSREETPIGEKLYIANGFPTSFPIAVLVPQPWVEYANRSGVEIPDPNERFGTDERGRSEATVDRESERVHPVPETGHLSRFSALEGRDKDAAAGRYQSVPSRRIDIQIKTEAHRGHQNAMLLVPSWRKGPEPHGTVGGCGEQRFPICSECNRPKP
jgi:hypothetical protein